MIDKILEKRFGLLFGKYHLLSREHEVIYRVSGWVHDAARSLIPNSPLMLAQDNVEVYERRETADKSLVEDLLGIVKDAWKIYGEVEVVR
jgi:hypothetical protein